jgi:hypothetical protein
MDSIVRWVLFLLCVACPVVPFFSCLHLLLFLVTHWLNLVLTPFSSLFSPQSYPFPVRVGTRFARAHVYRLWDLAVV